uniref:Uncharacterized protein n=1 Tax=Stomoxys calcitrans TaxID=35570 RepID=A0A1I8Q406_STOCA
MSTAMGAYCKTRYYAYNLVFMITILSMKFNYYEFTTTTSVNKGFYTNSGNTSSSVLRFRDFEPRSFNKLDTEVGLPRQLPHTAGTNRKSRGFQFHADDKDVSIEMEFIIPFVRIPIERSMHLTKTAFRNLFNLNTHSILTTGAVVAIGGILAILAKLIFSPFGGIGIVGGYKKSSRSSAEYPPWHQLHHDNSSTLYPNNFVSYVESKLYENDIDLGNCIQKTICDYRQRNVAGGHTGTAGSIYKIIDGIMGLKSVHSVLNGTAVKDALDAAKSGRDCSLTYRNCNWNPPVAKKALGMLAKISTPQIQPGRLVWNHSYRSLCNFYYQECRVSNRIYQK